MAKKPDKIEPISDSFEEAMDTFLFSENSPKNKEKTFITNIGKIMMDLSDVDIDEFICLNTIDLGKKHFLKAIYKTKKPIKIKDASKRYHEVNGYFEFDFLEDDIIILSTSENINDIKPPKKKFQFKSLFEQRNSFSIWLVFDKKLQGYNTCICLEVDLSSPCFDCLEDSYIQELKSPAVSLSAHSRQNYY